VTPSFYSAFPLDGRPVSMPPQGILSLTNSFHFCDIFDIIFFL